MTTTTAEVTLGVELMDPFGTIVGRGAVTFWPQIYAHDQDPAELLTVQTALKVGKYIQADPPGSGLLAFSMRLISPD